MSDLPKSDYDEYPKTLPRDDFWGQVRRTIDGRRISEEEVGAIVESINRELRLSGEDVLLDLACGNGALTQRLFPSCRAVVGVDRSAYLIEIAQENFQRPPHYVFLADDILTYLRAEPDPGRFTKALCYGSVMFLTAADVASMLAELHDRFSGVQRVVLGNVPDRDRVSTFLERNRHITHLDVDDPAAQAGRWWSQKELAEAAADGGWEAAFTRMSPEVFNTWYRYDAVLTRRGGARRSGS